MGTSTQLNPGRRVHQMRPEAGERAGRVLRGRAAPTPRATT